MFQSHNTAAVLIDVQEKLFTVMHGRDILEGQITRLLKGLVALQVPILCTEQLPDKLGTTVPALAQLLTDKVSITKSTFSCGREPAFMQAVAKEGRQNIVLCGIETHVCVYQTAAHLMAQGYAVQVIADATSSRTRENRDIGIARMQALGVDVSSVESTLFELLEDARHPSFKNVLAAVR
ncbi:MAG: isochorismatase family protein [Verrucomicrobia bacterium]|nr:isochorismatase family protein [Verrucomicrobiota bacterium]